MTSSVKWYNVPKWSKPHDGGVQAWQAVVGICMDPITCFYQWLGPDCLLLDKNLVKSAWRGCRRPGPPDSVKMEGPADDRFYNVLITGTVMGTGVLIPTTYT
jgi:hypothetical protein